MLEADPLLRRHARKALADVVPVVVARGDDGEIHGKGEKCSILNVGFLMGDSLAHSHSLGSYKIQNQKFKINLRP
jgi:hypothetical protein